VESGDFVLVLGAFLGEERAVLHEGSYIEGLRIGFVEFLLEEENLTCELCN
jgi:hypothetical protein